MTTQTLKPNQNQTDPMAYVYFGLFFISGISGLIYESIWSQYLKQFLGHAAYAQMLVLIIFMGGMALGSWLVAAYMHRIKNLFFAYAIVEIVLGMSALVFHDVFLAYLNFSFSTAIPFLRDPIPVNLYRWGSASIMILPQAILLGATFPLMAGGILRRFPGLSGYKTSVVYFANTFGAAIGVLFCGFYFVKNFGLRGAIGAGGFIDLFVGIVILGLCYYDRSSRKNSLDVMIDDNFATVGDNVMAGISDNYNHNKITKTVKVINDVINYNHQQNSGNVANAINDKNDINDVNDGGDNINDDKYNEWISDYEFDESNKKFDNPYSLENRKNYYHPLLFISGLTAVAHFIYEIGWIRMLSLVLGSSTHSFELMLSAFILGLAIGSFIVRKKLDTIRNAPRFLGIVQIVLGITAIITLFTYGNMFQFMVFTIEGLGKTPEGYVFFNIISHLICMVIMLPTTICAGMVVPLIIHMLYKKGYGEQAIGKVYAVNTVGGILGVAATVWLLMELVGLKFVIIIGAAIDMGLGLYVLHRFRETRRSITYAVAQPVVVFVLVIACAFGTFDPILASSGVFRYGSISRSKRIVEHVDGRTASISLFKSGSGRSIVLSTNGKPDASIGLDDEISGDEYTMALLGVLPLAIHENARTTAVIGMGAGMTSHFMLYDPNVELLDVIEIERAVPRLARQMGPRVQNTFTDPRSRIHIEDAKTFFSAGSRTYDLIVSEPSNPWVSGVSSLFSKEFFERVRDHLNDGGLLMQWFHMYEADITILVSILKALELSFPVYEMYLVSSDLLIIAAKDADRDISIKRDVFEFPEMAQSLGLMGINTLDDLRMLRFADHRFFSPYINDFVTAPNSDFHSHVNNHAARHRFMGTNVRELTDIRDYIIPVRRIAFADTHFVRFNHNAPLPDLYNVFLVQQAKNTLEELMMSVMFKDFQATANTVALDFALARPERVSFSQLQNPIIQILQKTYPYLSADEMRDVWHAIDHHTAKLILNEGEKLWMEYIRALCYYDLPEIRRLSLELLPVSDIDDHTVNRMLLTSLLASAAALEYDAGFHAGIVRAWQRYEHRDFPAAPLRAALAIYMRSVAGEIEF